MQSLFRGVYTHKLNLEQVFKPLQQGLSILLDLRYKVLIFFRSLGWGFTTWATSLLTLL